MPETQTQLETQTEIHAETQAQTPKTEKRGRDGLAWVSFGLGASGLWRQGSCRSAWRKREADGEGVRRETVKQMKYRKKRSGKNKNKN